MSFDRAGFYREIGLRVRIERNRARLKQSEVAQELGMPRATYANVERGRQRVAVDVIWRLAVVLGVPVQVLMPPPVRDLPASSPLIGLTATTQANTAAPETDARTLIWQQTKVAAS